MNIKSATAAVFLIIISMLFSLTINLDSGHAESRRFLPVSQPWLSHALSQETAGELSGFLPTHSLTLLQRLAEKEQTQIEMLNAQSNAVLSNPGITLHNKRRWVQESGYNLQMEAILTETQRLVRLALGRSGYGRLLSWAEQKWEAERINSFSAGGIDLFNPLPEQQAKTYPRSFEVYATRYDAGDRYIVALPDKCLKFANAGAMLCNDGYQYNQNYSVAISYKGKLVVATVLESGPWNIDDNFWTKSSDPQPRRMFTDLPLGVPAAQAAFFNGYNNGLDQFGRKVTSPVAIDISYKVAKDLDLPSGNNKVTISFLWTEGWDQVQPVKDGKKTEKPFETTPGEIQPVSPAWATAEANPDGSRVHIVQAGQTLTGIATVYGVPLEEILTLNNLEMDSIIQPDDRIVVEAAKGTAGSIKPTGNETEQFEGSPTPATQQPPSPADSEALSATLPVSGLVIAATRTSEAEQKADGQATGSLGIETKGSEPDSLVSILVIAMCVIGVLIAAWAFWKERGRSE